MTCPRLDGDGVCSRPSHLHTRQRRSGPPAKTITIAINVRTKSAKPRNQLHFDLLACTKLLNELTTFAAALVTDAIWLGEGFALSVLTALVSVSTEDLMALVSLGKSLLAWLTTVLASVWILMNAASKALVPLLGLRLVTSLIEFSRLVRAVQ